jgi:hypothetical protein
MPWRPPRYAQISFLVRLACYVTRISPQLFPSSPVPDTVVRRPTPDSTRGLRVGQDLPSLAPALSLRGRGLLRILTERNPKPAARTLLTMMVGTPPVSTNEPLVTIAKIEQKP